VLYAQNVEQPSTQPQKLPFAQHADKLSRLLETRQIGIGERSSGEPLQA
jgi:hypothetical protein